MLLVAFSLILQLTFLGSVGLFFLIRCLLLLVFFAPFIWKTRLALILSTSIILAVCLYSLLTEDFGADLPVYNVFGLYSWVLNWHRTLDYIISPGYKFIYLAYIIGAWLMRPYRSNTPASAEVAGSPR